MRTHGSLYIRRIKAWCECFEYVLGFWHACRCHRFCGCQSVFSRVSDDGSGVPTPWWDQTDILRLKSVSVAIQGLRRERWKLYKPIPISPSFSPQILRRRLKQQEWHQAQCIALLYNKGLRQELVSYNLRSSWSPYLTSSTPIQSAMAIVMAVLIPAIAV